MLTFLISSQAGPTKNLSQLQNFQKLGGLEGSYKIVMAQIHDMAITTLQALPLIMIAILILILFVVIAKVVKTVIKHITLGRKFFRVGLVLARLSQWFIILMGIFISLAIIFPSITLASLLGGIGLMGIVAGVALKDILHNFVAGILILLKQPFKIGDEIHFMSSRNKDCYGKVEHIDTRYTFLRSFDGRRILIPNGDIYTNVVVINTTYGFRRSQQDITIGPFEKFHPTCEKILAALDKIEGVLKTPKPEILIVNFSPNALVARIRWWSSPDRKSVLWTKHTVSKAIQEILIECKVNIPYEAQLQIMNFQSYEDGNPKNIPDLPVED
jgi:small-conductance mechanosensitive channel